ncbi:hypothetical protein [Curvibacter phage PCA1]|nr:hypothetical protein [Curvibacter phage PCA1]
MQNSANLGCQLSKSVLKSAPYTPKYVACTKLQTKGNEYGNSL